MQALAKDSLSKSVCFKHDSVAPSATTTLIAQAVKRWIWRWRIDRCCSVPTVCEQCVVNGVFSCQMTVNPGDFEAKTDSLLPIQKEANAEISPNLFFEM